MLKFLYLTVSGIAMGCTIYSLLRVQQGLYDKETVRVLLLVVALLWACEVGRKT